MMTVVIYVAAAVPAKCLQDNHDVLQFKVEMGRKKLLLCWVKIIMRENKVVYCGSWLCGNLIQIL
jgi:hypothetical protein